VGGQRAAINPSDCNVGDAGAFLTTAVPTAGLEPHNQLEPPAGSLRARIFRFVKIKV
jgi:hypothetical protein